MAYVHRVVFQSTPSARRATVAVDAGQKQILISIHALREESDQALAYAVGRQVEFQSTPSARRATWTHLQKLFTVVNFNPRPPRGERLSAVVTIDAAVKFQSTPSARRATVAYAALGGPQLISIHALREESDPLPPGPAAEHKDFNPRPPRGERLSSHGSASQLLVFQSTPSARRATRRHLCGHRGKHISIHALREESDFG